MPDGQWITARQGTQLNPRLAGLYGKVGERVPARDFNDLVKMGLVDKDGRTYRARRGVIRAFIPPTWEAPHNETLDEALSDMAPPDEPKLFDEE